MVKKIQKGMNRIKKLTDYLSKQDYIKFAYLFGSVAGKKEGKLSDVDIAIFLDEKLSKKERISLQLEMVSHFMSLLKTDRIDVVIMNDAPILLKYNIIKHGKILKDDEKRAEVEAKILSTYLDMKYYIDKHTNLALKRIAEKGLL